MKNLDRNLLADVAQKLISHLMERKDVSDTELMNKITLGVYELGSVFKTFTIAAALEKGIVDIDTEFQNLENKIKCRDKWISEHDELPKNLNVEQILVRSSNIGSIKIARKIGSEDYSNFLHTLGLLEKIDFDISEVGTPLPFKWENCALETASYGHGITTTPLQLARAYAIIGNGGYAIEPTLIKTHQKTQREIYINIKIRNFSRSFGSHRTMFNI